MRLASYGMATLAGILHTVFNIYVRKFSPMDEKSMGEGYERIIPGIRFITSCSLRCSAGCICARCRLRRWVMIKHPWSLTLRGFYLDYQL